MKFYTKRFIKFGQKHNFLPWHTIFLKQKMYLTGLSWGPNFFLSERERTELIFKKKKSRMPSNAILTTFYIEKAGTKLVKRVLL